MKSKSVFPSALGHAGLGVAAAYSQTLLVALGADEIMTIPLGLPTILALLVLAALAYVDLSR